MVGRVSSGLLVWVEPGGWGPFGVSVGDADGPAELFEVAVVEEAEQAHVVDICGSAVLPFDDVVDLGPGCRAVAAGERAAAVARGEGEALSLAGQALFATQGEDFAVVLEHQAGDRVREQPAYEVAADGGAVRGDIELGLDKYRFTAVVRVHVGLTARAADRLRIAVDIEPPTHRTIDVDLQADGVRASVVQVLGNVEGEIKKAVAKFVRREIDKPELRAARIIDVEAALHNLSLKKPATQKAANQKP